MNTTPIWLTIATIQDGALSTHQQLYFADLLKQELTDHLDADHGAGRWVIVPTAELPADFNPETYTIENGVLVKASAEQIAEREAIAAAAYNEQQRALREAEYRATTDPQVIELLADATPEIAALKAQIREKYPYK